MNVFETWFLAIGGPPRPDQLLFATSLEFPHHRRENSSKAQLMFNILTISILFYDLSL